MKQSNLIFLFVLLLNLVSCEELLEVEDISGQEVSLLAPSDSTIVSQNTVSFTWNELLEANSYRVQVAEPSFLEASQVVLDTLILKDSTYLGPRFSTFLPDDSYEWRVKGINSDFETGYTTSSFIVDATGN